MRARKQPVVRLLLRGALIAAVSACSLTAWAQSNGQGGAAPPAKSSVAPSPADLEPGVNTSATQTSSPEPVPAPAPASLAPAPASKLAPAPKPAQTSAKRIPTSPSGAASPSGSSAGDGAASAGAANGATTTGATNGANTGGTAASTTKSGAAKTGAAAGKAHDSIELDTTQITGNRELPKVLYIVPWKRSDLGDLAGKPVNSLLDEVLTPVDRDVFKRQNRYYDALKPDDAKDAAGAATGVNEKH